MRPGPVIRRMFGPYERGVSEAYRRIYVDLDGLGEQMHAWVPQAKNILEVGCGEGAMTERIARTYPTATVTAIDISPKVGRLFRGPSEAVSFWKKTVQEVACEQPASFDLVVLADVMHHVPVHARRSLLHAIDQAMTPNGSLVFKDWLISASPIHWMCAAADRYLTGDEVEYFTVEGMHSLVADVFGPGAIRLTDTVRPRRNNIVLLVRRSDQAPSQSGETAGTSPGKVAVAGLSRHP